MARAKSTELRARMRSLIPSSSLRSLARTTGFVQRMRQLELPAFLFTLAFGGGQGDTRRICGFWEAYLVAARRRLSRTSFYERLSADGIVEWLRAVIAEMLPRMTDGGGRLAGELGQFRDLFIADASQVALPETLRRVFPGSRSNSTPAAAKIHVVQRVHGSGLQDASVTDGRTNDSKVFRVGEWVRGGLVLMDLAYFNYRRFARIQKYGGYFVSRLKAKANPKVVRSNIAHPGRAIDVTGKQLSEVLHRLRRKVIDLVVSVKPHDRKGARRVELRLVGVWNEQDQAYHLYLTNVRPEMMTAEQISETYRLRWQVELFFRELKSSHRLSQLPGENPRVLEAMLYASILAALVTRRIVHDIRARLRLEEFEFTDEQGARLVNRFGLVLHLIATARSDIANQLSKQIQGLLDTIALTYVTPRHNLVAERLSLRGREFVAAQMG